MKILIEKWDQILLWELPERYNNLYDNKNLIEAIIFWLDNYKQNKDYIIEKDIWEFRTVNDLFK